MSLTKEDKEEISKIIVTELKKIMPAFACNMDEAVDKNASEVANQCKEWDENAIETGLGFKVAPADLVIDNQEYFTWYEAMEIEKKYLRPNGWRLPTCSEWYQLVGKFGLDEDGGDAPDKFLEKFEMERKGYYDITGFLCVQGAYGYWWSSTVRSDTNSRNLRACSSVLYPQYSNDKSLGLSVRCVSDSSEDRRSEL